MTITLERVPAGPAREELTALLPGYLRGGRGRPLPVSAAVLDRSRPLSLSDPRAGPDRRLRPGPATARQRRLRNGRVLRAARLPRAGPGAQAARAFAAHPGAWRIGIMATTPARCASGARSRRRRPQPPREADGEDGFWMLSLPGAPPTRASDQTAPPQDAQQVRVATPADTPAILAVDALAWRIPRAPGRSRGPSNRDNAGSRSTPAASWLCDAGPRLFGHGFVSLIVVAAACRRQGVALRLLQAA